MTNSFRRWDPHSPTLPKRGNDFYPTTFIPNATGPGVHQEPIFDPALKMFSRAFRAGEPEFTHAAQGLRWRSARRAVVTHVLRLVATSPWRDHLVLRGSVPLQAWLGDIAREPGDIDWVVTPPDLGSDTNRAADLLANLIQAVADAPFADPDVRLDAADVAADDIWTYDRVPGRRLVFPWHATGLPSGTVQLDFVFNEPLPMAPQPMPVGPAAESVLAVGPQLSLAWKILWLVTDSYPQGKDLYDAVLLAERTSLPVELLREVLRSVPDEIDDPDGFGIYELRSLLSADWAEFQAEYRWVTGTLEEWADRLLAALQPTFD